MSFSAVIYLLIVLMFVGMVKSFSVGLNWFCSMLLFYVIFVYKLSFWQLSKKE